MRDLDRALDTLLADELAGRTPPDLSQRILAAAAGKTRSAVDRGDTVTAAANTTPGRAAGRRRSLLHGMLLGAVAVGALWYGAVWHQGAAELAPTLPQVRGRVVAGTLTWQRGTVGTVASEFRTVSPQPGGFVAGSITVTALVGAASWFGNGETIDSPSDRIVLAAENENSRNELASADLTNPELLAARQRIAELETQIQDRTKVAIPTADDPEPPVAIAAIDTGSEFAPLLAEVDWREVGEAVSAYVTVKQKMEALIAAGEPIPLELRAAVERLDMALFEQIASTLEQGVPGATMTAKIHHPALVTNMLNATMNAAGMPLDASQERWLTDIGRRFTAEDAARRAGYSDQALDLERFVDEIEMQERFSAEQHQVLTASQEERLSFGALSERAGVDPFGSGYQWSKNNRAIEVQSRGELVTRAAGGYADALELTSAQQARLQPMIQRWVSRWPSRWLDLPRDELDRNGRMHIGRIRTAGTMQVELMREMAAGLGLTPAQLEALRRQRQIFVPFLTQ